MHRMFEMYKEGYVVLLQVIAFIVGIITLVFGGLYLAYKLIKCMFLGD